MTCSVCGVVVQPVVHHFYEGDYQRPARRWKIIAPKYFLASKDFRGAVEVFCGPECSLAYSNPART